MSRVVVALGLLALQKMARKCLDEGIRRGLKGKEFDRLLATCYQPEKSN